MSNAVGVIIAGTNIYVDAATEEKAEHNNDITEYPIEDGSKIHSHAHLLPRMVTVEGIVAGPGYQTKVARLKGIRESRDIVSYSGRIFYASLVIKELMETYEPGLLNGCHIRVVFQEVKIVGGIGGGGPMGGPERVGNDPAGNWWSPNFTGTIFETGIQPPQFTGSIFQ